jgi:hypothetical protein
MHATTYLQLVKELAIHGIATLRSSDRMVSKIAAKVNAMAANYLGA